MTMWDFSFSIVLKKWEVWNGRWENNWNLKTYNKLDNQITVQLYIKKKKKKTNYENCVRLCVTVKKTIHYFHAPTKLFVIQNSTSYIKYCWHPGSMLCFFIYWIMGHALGHGVLGTCLEKLEDNVFFLIYLFIFGKMINQERENRIQIC